MLIPPLRLNTRLLHPLLRSSIGFNISLRNSPSPFLTHAPSTVTIWGQLTYVRIQSFTTASMKHIAIHYHFVCDQVLKNYYVSVMCLQLINLLTFEPSHYFASNSLSIDPSLESILDPQSCRGHDKDIKMDMESHP